MRCLLAPLLLFAASVPPSFAQGESPIIPAIPSEPENRHLHTSRFSIAPSQEFTLPKLEHESVVVSLSSGRLDRHPTIGEPETLDLVPGRSFAVRGSSNDLLTNRSASPIELLVLELKDSYAYNQMAVPRSARDPLEMDPQHIRLELENENVRVLRVYLKPRESTEESQFGMRLEIPLTDALARQVAFDGQVSQESITAGALTWQNYRIESLINTGDNPLDLLMVEFKHPFCYFLPQTGFADGMSDEKDEKATAYLRNVYEKIRKTWNKHLPREVLDGEPGYIVLTFNISNDGTLTEGGVSLAVAFADDTAVGKAMAAIRDAGPFPPFPPEVTRPELVAHYFMAYNLPKISHPGCP